MQAPRKFWGVKVKAGQSVKVGPRTSSDGYSHISQLALGKASEPVALYLKYNDQEFVLGTLSNKFPQFLLDIVLDKESELFHNSENATVYVCGYKIFWDNPNVDKSPNSDNVDNENAVALEDKNTAKVKAAKGTEYGKTVFEIGESSKQLKIGQSSKQVKIGESSKQVKTGESSKQVKIGQSSKQVKIGQLSKQVRIIDLENDDEFYDVSSDEDDSDSFNPMDISDEESESYEVSVSDWDEEEEYTSSKKKVGPRKRKPSKSAPKTSAKKAKKATKPASKTSVSSKKATKATTKKADGKKGRTTTSGSMKKVAKTPANISEDRTPDSGGENTPNNISKDQTPTFGGGKRADNISKEQTPNSEAEKIADTISKDLAPDSEGEKSGNNNSKEQTHDSGEKRNYIDLNETYEEELSG